MNRKVDTFRWEYRAFLRRIFQLSPELSSESRSSESRGRRRRKTLAVIEDATVDEEVRGKHRRSEVMDQQGRPTVIVPSL